MTAHLDAFAPELARLDVLIEIEMRRMRARYELSADELHGLYITEQRVEALLRDSGAPISRADVPEVGAARETDTRSRWHYLALSLQLTDDERDMLLLCVAPELDTKYETVYAYLNDDVTRRWPTCELALRLFGRSADHRVKLLSLLLPNATLIGSGAIETAPAFRDYPRGRRALRVAAPLADWLRGASWVDERLHGIARFVGVEETTPDDAFPLQVRSPFRGLSRRLARRAWVPPVVLSAPTPLDAARAAENLFAHANRLALIVDLAALRGTTAADCVSALELAQRVLGVGLILSPLDALVDADGRVVDSSAAAIRDLARRSPALVFAAGPSPRIADVLGDLMTLHVAIPELTPRERAAAWRAALVRDDTTPGVETASTLVGAIADRFALGTDQIFRAAAAAMQAAAVDGAAAPTSAQVFAAARSVSADGSGGTSKTVATSFDWDDLILPPDAKGRLADIVHAIERRARVLDEWGFAERVGGARGIRVMFAGPSGTGKTMAAAIVARTLQLDLHRIELGTVVSKYLGDTEKNFDKAFAAARRANAVLFIDEADAVLGKRSQVKDAHDRYANVEIAYLLQKMEDHDGIVIIATNLAQNIDEAFSRRMQFVIEFPMPDALSRERLWRGLMPRAAPLGPDVDFTFLARQFELAGGDIRNVVLDAAYRAAHDESAITMGHILRAIARQYAKRGRIPTAADFREHYPLLAETPATPGR